MAIEHTFGGSWTEVKLDCLRKYLQAYRQLFRTNARAQFFKTWFVDAFAGTGRRSNPAIGDEQPLFDDVYADADAETYREGSATIALSLPDPFDKYLFIEKSAHKLATLKNRIATVHPERLARCSFRPGDANELLKRWCNERNWTKERAVVFLDPYGTQVEWSTIESLASTKGVDLWYLFPLGVGVSRLLTHTGDIEASCQARLDLLFGTPTWRDRFYRRGTTVDLFGETRETLERTAAPEQIGAFIRERLQSCFVGVAKGLVLRNSRSNPMYLLCFAASNERGKRVGVKIAGDILKE